MERAAIVLAILGLFMAIINWGKTRVLLSGDEERAKPYLHQGALLLDAVRTQLQLSANVMGAEYGLKQYRMERRYSDGTIIEALSVLGEEQVRIYTPPIVTSVNKVEEEVENVLLAYGVYIDDGIFHDDLGTWGVYGYVICDFNLKPIRYIGADKAQILYELLTPYSVGNEDGGDASLIVPNNTIPTSTITCPLDNDPTTYLNGSASRSQSRACFVEDESGNKKDTVYEGDTKFTVTYSQDIFCKDGYAFNNLLELEYRWVGDAIVNNSQIASWPSATVWVSNKQAVMFRDTYSQDARLFMVDPAYIQSAEEGELTEVTTTNITCNNVSIKLAEKVASDSFPGVIGNGRIMGMSTFQRVYSGDEAYCNQLTCYEHPEKHHEPGEIQESGDNIDKSGLIAFTWVVSDAVTYDPKKAGYGYNYKDRTVTKEYDLDANDASHIVLIEADGTQHISKSWDPKLYAVKLVKQ